MTEMAETHEVRRQGSDCVPIAERLAHFPPYIFAEMSRQIAEVAESGRKVYDLGISDPNQPPRAEILSRLAQAAQYGESHRYPSYRGLPRLRQAVSQWYGERFGVELDPDREVLITVGSKEALIHLALAVVDPGRAVLVPDPGYPAYHMPQAIFGMDEITLPLLPEHDFLPDFKTLSVADRHRIALAYFNYPNNPTGAVASLDFWREVLQLARLHDWTVVSDLAYANIYYDDAPHSLLELEGAREVAVESITFSKTYNMQGWRLAAVVGNARVIDALYRLESQINAGVFNPVQEAGVVALELGPDPEVLKDYKSRRELAFEALQELGFRVSKPAASVYYWISLGQEDSVDFARNLLRKSGVALAPGSAFGHHSRHYARLSLTSSDAILREAFVAWKLAQETRPE